MATRVLTRLLNSARNAESRSNRRSAVQMQYIFRSEVCSMDCAERIMKKIDKVFSG
jgi:hypothetical protein